MWWALVPALDREVQGQLRVQRQRAHELLDELVVEVADRAGRKRGLERAQPAPGDVDRARRPGLVHRDRGLAVAGDAGAVAERLVERLADADADVLDRVMGAGLEVAARLDAEVEAAVAGQQVEHVIEEADAGVALAGAVAVEREARP